MNEISDFIGIKSSRPELETDEGPDNLWFLENSKYLIIECKNETTTNTISKHDCNQINGSLEWFKDNYPNAGENYYGLLIHNSNVLNYDAYLNDKVRIMTPDLLDKFKGSIRNFAHSFTRNENFKSINNTDNNLKHNNLLASQIIKKYTIEPKK